MNPNRGALLKPSERSGAKPTTSFSRQQKVSRYEVLKDKIRTWWNDRLKIGEALREIRDDKLYKADYSNFEDFCVDEFNLKHSQAYALIAAVAVKESVTNGNKPSAIAETITNEGQTRALAKVPTEQRVAVLEKAVASGNGKVTAKTIAQAAKAVIKNTEKNTAKADAPLDKLNRTIPEEIREDWQRAEQTGKKLVSLAREIKSIVSEGFAGAKQDRVKDVIYAEISNSQIAEAEGLAWGLSSVIPYAVCPTCQGVNRKSCGLCKKRGWISRFMWNSPVVSPETRALLEKKK